MIAAKQPTAALELFFSPDKSGSFIKTLPVILSFLTQFDGLIMSGKTEILFRVPFNRNLTEGCPHFVMSMLYSYASENTVGIT